MSTNFNNAVGPQVRSSKPKIGKIIPVLAIISLIAGLQTATQYFAYEFQYHASLGMHVSHIYLPWGILEWAYKWYGEFPHAFMRAGSIGISVTASGLVCLVIVKMIAANSSKTNQYIHGSARWANKKDIQAAGLLPKK